MGQCAEFDPLRERKGRANIGRDLALEQSGRRVWLYRQGVLIKDLDLYDPVAMRLFVVESVELGANQSRLAAALSISRQTIHNYRQIKKHFGMEGLIRGYSLEQDQRKQRQKYASIKGNKAKAVAAIRRSEGDQHRQAQRRQSEFNFSFGPDSEASKVAVHQQPFSEEHDWVTTRYAGTFSYIICLTAVWRWLALVMGHFGEAYRIFMVFLLMVARNIRSLEQMKNVRMREAGVILGLRRVLSKPKLWRWFYAAADKGISRRLLHDYFAYQIRSGLVSVWMWFTDGHRLPYTGRERVHHSYNTQRRMPMPGHTNLVSSDADGRIVDFEIQEGQGDLRLQIRGLSAKWAEQLKGGKPIQVFDREGHGAPFFSALVKQKIPFVTWDKNVNVHSLADIAQETFVHEFEFNAKKYRVFEKDKHFTYKSEDPENSQTQKQAHTFTLRHIHIWNQTSNRRTCGLAWTGEHTVSTEDCTRAILSRWGASENTFKHCKDRHPLHYHPGLKFEESERQEIANPAVKEKQRLLDRLKKDLNSLREKLGKSKEVLNKDGTPRQNSRHKQLKQNIAEKEAEVQRLKDEKRELPETVDVSTLTDYRSFRRIDSEGKNLFDFVTCSVWNARKQMVAWLRPDFGNDDEVVDLFYAITSCHGWIRSTATEVVVRLEPLEQARRRAAQEQLCRRLSGLLAQSPTGKWLVIEVGEAPLRC